MAVKAALQMVKGAQIALEYLLTINSLFELIVYWIIKDKFNNCHLFI